MNKSERLKVLLEKGYFPEELPPPFNALKFAKYRISILKKWAKFNNDAKATYETYSKPRIKATRRNLAIVNPIPQIHLCNLIAENWTELFNHFRRSKYTLNLPEIGNSFSRSVPKPDFLLIALRKNEISANFDHALVSDISRFYGTLYTHAIPWALHGKDWCKNNLHEKSYKNSLGARLDKAVRKGQDNQTIGIPVGPDTSRIISEIVGVAIDQFVQEKIKIDKNRAFRNIDDWFIGFDNASEAEDAIATLATGCRKFELELNAEKTKTFHSSSTVDNDWATELREYNFKKTPKGQASSIEHYFIKAFNFSHKYPDQNILNYAVKRTRSIQIKEDNWRNYETFLLKIARTNQTIFPTIVEILVSYNNDGFPLDQERIQKLIEDIIRKSAPVAHHDEIAWALFLAKALKIILSENTASSVSYLESSVCALLALDLQERGLFKRKLDVSIWLQSMNGLGLYSNMWLLAYEADFKGWLSGKPKDFVSKDKYFEVLKSKKISFYDEGKNITHIRQQKPKSLYWHSPFSFSDLANRWNLPLTSMDLW